MHPPVVTKDPAAVAVEVQSIFLALFPGDDPQVITDAFTWASDCFGRLHPAYQAIDAPYHDFEHTLQGTLCLARLLRGRQAAGAEPEMTPRMFQLGILAILLHDTGYLKRRGDDEGSGAKYTIVHVGRSAEFARELMSGKGFGEEDIRAVQNMIHCTGLEIALGGLRFQSELERQTGFALGTADLVGQMAAGDYVERLPALYREFAEAAKTATDRNHMVTRYSSADDLMRRTPHFWEHSVRPKLEREFKGMVHFLSDPFPNGPNLYVERIESNMARLQRLFPS